MRRLARLLPALTALPALLAAQSLGQRVDGWWRRQSATDLGTVPAAGAASDLLALAEHASDDGGEALITAATLADGAAIWPRPRAGRADDG